MSPRSSISEAARTVRSVEPIIYKNGLAVMAGGLAGLIFCLLADRAALGGYAAGFIVGASNISWLLKSVRRGLDVPAEKVARYMLMGHIRRFVLTVLIVGLVVTQLDVNIWGFVGGLFAPVAATNAYMIFRARKEMY